MHDLPSLDNVAPIKKQRFMPYNRIKVLKSYRFYINTTTLINISIQAARSIVRPRNLRIYTGPSKLKRN
jgi:hypothetical protein